MSFTVLNIGIIANIRRINNSPMNLVAPIIFGTPEPGEILTVSNGTWSGTEPITYSYQWKLNDVDVSTTNNYDIPEEAEDGDEIYCVVTATNMVGSASVDSNTVTVEVAPPVDDPLAGLIIPLRVETFYEDETYNPLYQDAACTIPATSEVEVMGVFDHLTNNVKQADQSNSMKAPVLRYINGKPILRFDGVDDWLLTTLGSINGQVTYSALFKSNSPTFNNYWSLMSNSTGGVASRWGCFEIDNAIFHFNPFPAGVRKNGITLTSPFNMSAINEWMVLTVNTATASEPAERGIGQLEQLYYGAFDLAALIIHDPADTATVEAYLQDKRALLII